MKFKQAHSWRDRGHQVQEVKDACNEAIKALALPETDARALCFVHVRQTCNTLAAVPIKLQQNSERSENVPIILQLLGLSEVSSLHSVLGDLNKNAKVGFLVLVQFAVENGISVVLRVAQGSEPPQGFKLLADKLVEFSGMSDPDDKINRLLLPAYIRNALHSGGIHSKPDWVYSLGGVTYNFQQGKRVDCASWSHLLFAVLNSLAVVREAFESNAVSRIQSILAA